MIFYLDEVQKKLGYTFKNAELLRQCFTHKSFSDEEKGELNNERLEFLGDSVLGFVVTDFLYKNSKYSEGNMTNLKQRVVSCKPLADAIIKLKVEEYLLKHSSMEISNNIRENLFESIVAGIYLDGGLENARNFIHKNLLNKLSLDIKSGKLTKSEGESLGCTVKKAKPIDNKSLLNEYASKKKLGTVEYKEISKTCEDHNPTFKMQVLLNGKPLASAKGKSKKEAEQACAKKALEILKNKNTKNGK